MFSVYGRKIKLLEVKRILEEQTDEEHCLTAGQISQQLKTVGIPAARKAIYDDIKAINHFYQPKKKGGKAPHIELDENGEGFYLDNRLFSVADLKLMIDAISPPASSPKPRRQSWWRDCGCCVQSIRHNLCGERLSSPIGSRT